MVSKQKFHVSDWKFWVAVTLVSVTGIMAISICHWLNDAAARKVAGLRQISSDIHELVLVMGQRHRSHFTDDEYATLIGRARDNMSKNNELIMTGNALARDWLSSPVEVSVTSAIVMLDQALVYIAADTDAQEHSLMTIFDGLQDHHAAFNRELMRMESFRNRVSNIADSGALISLLMLALIMIGAQLKNRRDEEGRRRWLSEQVRLRTDELEESLNKNKDQLDSLKRANARLVMLNTSLERLQEASKYTALNDNAPPLMSRVLTDVMGLTEVDHGLMVLINIEGRVGSVFARGVLEQHTDDFIDIPAQAGVLGLVYGDAGPVRIDDLRSHAQFNSEQENLYSLRSMLGVPILVSGVVRGMIILFDKRNGAIFDEDDEAILGLFAIDMSHAIDRMAILEELHARNSELEVEKNMQMRLIDKLQQAQSQLIQTEKMASIGQLAAGVAHEINNPVAYIRSNLNSLKSYLAELIALLAAYEQAVEKNGLADDIAADLNRIINEMDAGYLKQDLSDLVKESMEGADHVIKIVKDLKEFSHVDQTEFEKVDIHKGLESALNIAYNEIKYKAEISKVYGELPEVECVPTQLNQVFMNIIVNAAHAIQEKGRITIKTGAVDDRVWIEISDTGKGISPEVMNKIFDPFFTTKPVGKGTGLGLSITYGIVAKHNGKIEVESKLGEGTRFRVWLPIRHSNAASVGPVDYGFHAAAGGN